MSLYANRREDRLRGLDGCPRIVSVSDFGAQVDLAKVSLDFLEAIMLRVQIEIALIEDGHLISDKEGRREDTASLRAIARQLRRVWNHVDALHGALVADEVKGVRLWHENEKKKSEGGAVVPQRVDVAAE